MSKTDEELVQNSESIVLAGLPHDLTLLLFQDAIVQYAANKYVEANPPTKKGSDE